jgi:lysozyme
MTIVDDLIRDEGLKLHLYDDATGNMLLRGDKLVGNPTIGIGTNLLGGITGAEARFLCQNRVNVAAGDLDHNVPWWRKLPYAARRGLLNMAFNMGWPRLAGFKQMLAALEAGDYPTAAAEALASAWAKEVGDRALRIADLFKNA